MNNAKWIKRSEEQGVGNMAGFTEYECSCCGQKIIIDDDANEDISNYTYCFSCGAYMLGDKEAESWKDTGLISQYADENKKLSDLLSEAVKLIDALSCKDVSCRFCKHCYSVTKKVCDGSHNFEWQYYDAVQEV